MLEFTLDKTNIWEFLKETKTPIILYGMGNGADKILDEFALNNIKCSGIIASNEFVRYQQFRGFTVKKLEDIEKEHTDFIVAVAFASQLQDVMKHIYNIAKTHITLVPCVPVFGSVIMNIEFINTYKTEINKAYNLLADSQSKKVFAGALNFYYSGKLSYLQEITTEKSEAFNNIIRLNSTERYLDLGAYKGDTIGEFLNYSNNKYSSILALEPDIKNFKKLFEYAKNFNNTTLLQKGIWDSTDTLFFDNKAGRNSSINNKKGIPIQVTCVDKLFENASVTYIKMDVEGTEKQALNGAVSTLKSQKPKLNIAVYHTFEDLFNIILQINVVQPNYKFYLRHHPYIPCWDTNLYCI